MPNSRVLPNTNRLLQSLPPADLERLQKRMTPVTLPLRLTLATPDMRIEQCYFLDSGLVSMVAVLQDGAPVEIGVVGSEGMVGLPAVLGAGSSPTLAIVQLAATGFAIDAAVLASEFESNSAVRSVLLRYAQAMHIQVAQTAACNGRHDSEQRLARWLLMAHDRMGVNELPLTQEFLSTMLGVRRQQVSLAAAVLQKAGIIRYRHGLIEILDRRALESVACECYEVVVREFERLVSPSPGAASDK